MSMQEQLAEQRRYNEQIRNPRPVAPKEQQRRTREREG